MKKIFFLCIRGIVVALSFFSIVGMIFDLYNGGIYSFTNWTYSKMIIGTIIIGIGFSVPTLIYENANLPYTMKVLIHMGIGCTILLIVGYVVGWIPIKYGWIGCVVSTALEVMIAFILWFAFSLYYKNEAKKIDERLKRKKKRCGSKNSENEV